MGFWNRFLVGLSRLQFSLYFNNLHKDQFNNSRDSLLIPSASKEQVRMGRFQLKCSYLLRIGTKHTQCCYDCLEHHIYTDIMDGTIHKWTGYNKV